MVQTLKKVFSAFVSTMTIVSSVGFGSLGFANVASAATLTTGDLVKASGPAVYYYAVDGKRYVFPNEKTYFSWYSDFSAVKTISDAELAAVPIGGNVTVRPGTKLVKIQTDPKTYAVTKCGVLHWIESEAIAKSLYGDAWATRVIDVPDAFFVNYTIGSSIPTAVHPDGQTITYTGDSNNYVVWGGMKRKFASTAAWDANMLNLADRIVTTISYANGADVTGREGDLADTVCATGTPVVGGNLTVSLASDTPAGMTVPKNSSSVPLAKYVFAAGSGEIKITGLTVHRVGIGAAADFSNVYLYDQNGKRLTTGRTVNSTAHTAAFSSLSITVPAGGTTAVYVYGDFSSPSATGGQHSFEIQDAASVVVTSGTVGGSFPVRGNVFTVGTVLAGRLDVQKGATPANPTVGSAEAEVSNFKLLANTNDIKVNQITLYQAGSITNTDLTNFKLYQGATVVAEGASVSASGQIVIKFSTPYLISSGTTKVFALKAKVGGRADRTIKTYVEYTTDVNATDMVHNSGAAICIADTALGGCTTTGQGSFDGESDSSNFISVTTQGGTLTNAFNGPPTSNVAKGQQDVPFYKFALTSADNNLEIRNIRFSLAVSAGAAACTLKGTNTTADAGTEYFKDLKVKNLDTGAIMMGPTGFVSTLDNNSDSSGTITLSDSFTMAAGTTLNLAITADISNSEDATGELFGNNDCGYKITFQDFESNDIRDVDTGEFLALAKVIPNQDVVGNQQNVKSSSLTMSLAGSPSSGTIVKKSANVPIAGVVLTAGAQSSVLITSITLTCQAALSTSGNAFGSAAALANCDQRITSLALFDGATQVGIADAPDTTSGAAQISNMNYTLAAGSSKTLEVRATFSSTASTTSPFDQVSVGIAADGDVSAQDADSNTVTPTRSTGLNDNADGASPSVIQTIRNSGVVTYAADSNPVSTIVIAGKDVWVPFASYKATAQFEAMEIDRIAILASSTAGSAAADNAAFTAVAIASGGAVKGQDILGAGATGTKDIDLTNNKIVVPKNGSVNFQLWAKLTNIQSSSSVSGATTGVHRSGIRPSLGLQNGLTTGEWDANYFSSGTANIRSTGQSSGERVYASSTNATHGNFQVTRKSKPTVTKQSLSNTTLSNTDMDLLKFNVSADVTGSVAVKQIIFTLSKTNVTLANFRLRKGTTDMALGDIAINYASTSNSTLGSNLTDVEGGTVTAEDQTAGLLIVSFTNEEVISGSGQTYTLHATVGSAAAGDNVSVAFRRDPISRVLTGYLRSDLYFGGIASSTAIFVVDPSVTASSSQLNANLVETHSTGTFLWSDLSEPDHSTAIGTSGGTRDWTNDVYVEDISQTQTVSL